MNAQQVRFQIAQYESLRREIATLEARVVRIQFGGLTAIPLLLGTGEKLDLVVLVIMSPIIIWVGLMVLLYTQNSIMRVGKFVRESVEPLLATDLPAWERHLETAPENRSAESIQAIGALSAFVLYYAFASIFGGLKVEPFLVKLGLPEQIASNAPYFYWAISCGALLYFIPFARQNFKTTTK